MAYFLFSSVHSTLGMGILEYMEKAMTKEENTVFISFSFPTAGSSGFFLRQTGNGIYHPPRLLPPFDTGCS